MAAYAGRALIEIALSALPRALSPFFVDGAPARLAPRRRAPGAGRARVVVMAGFKCLLCGMCAAPPTTLVTRRYALRGAHCAVRREAMASQRKFYSLEFFPPHTVEGARNLVNRMDRLVKLKPKPLSMDVTWTLDAGKRCAVRGRAQSSSLLGCSAARWFSLKRTHLSVCRSFETLVAAQAICALDVQVGFLQSL